MVLTKREREFVEDWLRVQRGEMERIDFFRKWGTKKDDEGFLDDYEKVQRGEMSVEEFQAEVDQEGGVEALHKRNEEQAEEEVQEQEEVSGAVQRGDVTAQPVLQLEGAALTLGLRCTLSGGAR